MSKLAIFVVAVSLASANALAAALRDLDHAPSQEEIAAGRDLKLYDDGGTFSSKISDHGAIPRISELRDFLWSHWSRKRRGYVRLEFSDVDGDSTTISHIFVEPTDSGEWHVAVLQFVHWYGAGGVSSGWSVSQRPELASLSLSREKDMHQDTDVIVFLGTDGSEVWRL
jgi:hypothetical protein